MVVDANTLNPDLKTETAEIFAVESLTPTKKGHITLSNSAVGVYLPMQAVTLESFNDCEALKMHLLSDKIWLIISAALLHLL